MTKRQRIRRVSVGMLVAGLLTGLASPASAAITHCTISADPVQHERAVAVDGEEFATMRLINAFRAKHGRPALRLTSRLNRPAAWASNDSAQRGFSPSNHIDSLGRDIPTRLRQCGYTGYRRASEVNYYGWGGRGSGAAAVAWWKNSPPHRAALLNPRVTAIGIARAATGKVHWTVNMGDKQ
ncbi:MAG: CAP domain-containing protein [Pseudonocardiaceae bacterium]